MAARGQEVHDLSSLLDVLQRKVDDDNGRKSSISMQEVLSLFGRRAYGPMLLVIGLISISPATVVPGATWAFAALTLIVALQLAFHKRTPWMPRRALAMEVPEDKLAQFVKAVRPTAELLDRLIRPRLQFLADAPWVFLVALLCALAAIITFPLGLIPLAPLAPGFAIVAFGLGLTARDGVLLAAGGAVMALAFWILFTRVF